jgi:hypothetical protein
VIARRLAPDVRSYLLVFLALRLGVFVLSAVGVGLLPLPPGKPVSPAIWPLAPPEPGWHALFTALERQDAAWYLGIAEHGYRPDDGSAAFFPLYPLVVRVVSGLIGGHPLAAGLLVSNVAFALALVQLGRLTAEELGEETARRSVVYLAVFPTAFFFLAPYSESLYLLLSVMCFRAARGGRWWRAGALGALAALTRAIGIVLVPALLAEWYRQRRERGLAARTALGPVLVLAGPVVYGLAWAAREGDALAPIHAQAAWQRDLTSPITSLWNAVRDAARVGEPGNGYWVIDLIVVGVVLVALVASVRSLRPGYWLYGWLSVLVPLSYAYEPRPLLSMPRFAAVLFPVAWTIATARRLPPAPVVGSFAGGFALLSVLFVNWYDVF